MAKLTQLPLFAVLFIVPWGSAFAQGAEGESSAISNAAQSRGIIKRLLCKRFGNCPGGYGGYQQGGYGGYPQGYPGQIPAINIGISQSQSSAANGQGGYSNGAYPNNYQYNGNPGYGGYNQGNGGYGGYNQGYGGYNQGYGGYNQGYGGYQRPGYFGNGNGGYNNQFNGNYYGGGPGNGGYGFQGPFGDDVSDENRPEVDDNENDQSVNNYNQGPSSYESNDSENYAGAGSYAFAGRKAN